MQIIKTIEAFIYRAERQINQNRISNLMIKYDQQRTNLKSAYIGESRSIVQPMINILDDVYNDLQKILKEI